MSNHYPEPEAQQLADATAKPPFLNHRNPTVVLVHGAFAGSASWNDVIRRLDRNGVDALAVANPLRSVTGDAAYLRDVVAGLAGPVLLVGHSYGGMVITEAASGNPAVVGLAYVAAFAPDHGESAMQLSTRFPGSTLGETLSAYPISIGGYEFTIRRDAFHEQFAADVSAEVAGLMSRTQRPVTEHALSEPLPTGAPAWRSKPSWFVLGELDRNIPADLVRFEAQRANARSLHEVGGGSHALSVSHPDEVTQTILEALAGVADAERA
jgi:pimeloyl-ACP methyl ester carboxylesterase